MIADIIVGSVIALLMFLAVRYIVRRKSITNCGSCSGNCENCKKCK